MAHAVRIDRLVLETSAVLAAAGIEHRVLKGVALGHSVYPDVHWRAVGDADVLVADRQLTRAVGLLMPSLDVHRVQEELRPGFDDRFGKEVLLRTREGLELDLHRTLLEGALGLMIDLAELLGGSDEAAIADRTVPVLNAPQQLLHTAYAVLSDPTPRLASLRDVVQVIAVLQPDPQSVLALARHWRGEAVLAYALQAAWAQLKPGTEPELVKWATEYESSRRERRLIDAHRGPARAYTRHLAALAVLPSVRSRLAYLRALAWPQRSYLESRGFTRRSFVGRAWSRLRRRKEAG
jgi:hypothetical protein